VGFGVMCLFVKEGQYPPAPAYDKGQTGPVAAIRTYAKECHTRAHWLYVFLIAIGSGGILVALNFMIFFYKQTGLDLEQIGYVQGVGNLSMFFMILVSGWLADRYHPIRVVIWGLVLQTLVATPASLLWLFFRPDPQTSYYLWLAITIGLMTPAGALIGILDPVLFMRIFPRSRYGQFCSANALWRSLSIIFGGLVLGHFLDVLKENFGERTSYVSLPFWQLASYLLMLIGAVKLYGSWKRYGGDEAYIAPGDEDFVAMEKAAAAETGAVVAPVANVPKL
jgi:MFS family permease